MTTYFLFAAFYFMFWFENARIDAFKAGAIAANPHLTGTFHLTGVAYVFTNDTFIFTNGKFSEVGGTLLPLVYVCIIALTVLAGRLWRAIPILRRRRMLGTSSG